MESKVKQNNNREAEEEIANLMILADEYLEKHPDKFQALEPILKFAVRVLMLE
ncbi:hypothetical protein ACFLYB_03250 [Chloroflexota bacterium]